MPWSGCSTTSEFIELLNFGPGPMNIGCYIVTNGTYSVTIPPNTILQSGQYYVLSGQNTLAKGCGNADSIIHVDLNWTTCNCTNLPIPIIGDGFMQNGGGANEKVVLLDPNLNVVDAVSREIPATSSALITTSLLGSCGIKVFDLDNMGISYETINIATGIDNSFARKVDGDCGWVKTTAISAHAPNKTGSSSSATYDFTAVNTNQCGDATGSISIQVNSNDINALFPMNYTLGFDVDGNEILDANDQYVYGIDNSAPTIDITNLAYGRYRITVASSSSCNLKSYDFYVFNCYTIILPVKLLYFTYEGGSNGRNVFKLRIENASTVNSIVLEAGNGGSYEPVSVFYGPFNKDEMTIASDISAYRCYRLKLTNHAGIVSYSQEIKIPLQNDIASSWPNPVNDKMFVRFTALNKGKLSYTIINSSGNKIIDADVEANGGQQTIPIYTKNLNSGIYYFKMNGQPLQQAVLFRFVKVVN